MNNNGFEFLARMFMTLAMCVFGVPIALGIAAGLFKFIGIICGLLLNSGTLIAIFFVVLAVIFFGIFFKK